MAASRWMQGSNFYPWQLIILFLGLSLIIFIWQRKLAQQPKPKPESPAATPPDLTPAEKEVEQQKLAEQRKQDLRLEEEAHQLILKMCKSKNIQLTLKQPGRSSGHYDIAEIWTIEKAFPLTPEDLYAITANRVLHVITKLRGDGIIEAHGFSRNGGWVSYELG